MVSINYATREVCCKIVYYGPGLSGKTTNLQVVHEKAPQNTRGKLISLATEADRTLYFDFLPINIGSINGFAAKFQLYTVPGQVYYNATRKLVLRGVDGVVFVADSQADKLDDNIESLSNLKENLQEYGFNINDLPIIIQYNKTDLPSAMTQAELDSKLNTLGWPSLTASAVSGVGVFDTLKMIMKMVLEKAKSGGSRQAAPVAASSQPSSVAAPPAAAAPGTTGSTSPEPISPAAPAAAASVFGGGGNSQSSPNVVANPTGAGYSAAASLDSTNPTNPAIPSSPSVAVSQPETALNQTPTRGVPTPGSIFGTKRSSAAPRSMSSSSPSVGAGAGALAPQSSAGVGAAAGENLNTKHTAHGGPSSHSETDPQLGRASQSAERLVTQPAPPATTEVSGHDPLEELPQAPPKKRGFFSRLFGRK